MKEKNELAKNVMDVITRCADEIGNFENDTASQNMFHECLEMGMESPIEQILYCALKTIRQINFIEGADPIYVDGKSYVVGLGIYPQIKIGNYRCDFEVSYYGPLNHENTQKLKSVIVECDSQQFHERTETERRYEKKRDRYLIVKGYKAFHFTGSEIVKNPFDIATEIISYLMDWDKYDVTQLNYN